MFEISLNVISLLICFFAYLVNTNKKIRWMVIICIIVGLINLFIQTLNLLGVL